MIKKEHFSNKAEISSFVFLIVLIQVFISSVIAEYAAFFVKFALPYKVYLITSSVKNYFVLSNLLAKMSLYVSFFITSNKKWNLEGSYAFHKKPPRRSKIWRKKNLLWILWAASSSYELPALPSPSLHVATPGKVFKATKTKIMCNIKFCSEKTY